MTATRFLRRLVATATALTLAACAGDGAASADAEASMADSTVTSIPREPLTEADLMGLSLADLSVEIPWTQNRVTRDPAPAQGPGWLESVEASQGEGFTRVSFTFSDIAFFPGYEVAFIAADSDIPCGEDGKPLSLSGERALVIRLKPANAHDDKGVRVRVRTRSLAPDDFTDGGLVCDLNDNVVWAAGVNSGDQVRVLEFRNPQRLVVDIR